MLGNGYCARSGELDCHFESICESCAGLLTITRITTRSLADFNGTLRAVWGSSMATDMVHYGGDADGISPVDAASCSPIFTTRYPHLDGGV